MEIFGTDIDLNNNEAKQFRVENGIALPSLTAGESGYAFFHSGLSKFYGWTGSVWTEFGAGAATGIELQDEASPIITGTQTIDFTGLGITVTDEGSNVGGVDISPTLDNITDNGNSTTNQIYLGKVWTSNIQNNDTGNLTISGNQGLILRNHNPNDGEVLITANGLISALTDNEATWTTRMSRSFTDSLTTANNKFWGMYINDTINMTSKTGSPYYSAIYIAPSVTGGGDIRSIYSLEGNALFEQGYVQADSFRLNALNTAPANASDTGTAGEIRIDANHIYVCTATDTWKRVAIATW